MDAILENGRLELGNLVRIDGQSADVEDPNA
jgi:hypothetical protein